MLSFRLKKQTSTNVADTTFKLDINGKFNNIHDKLVTIKSGFKENLDDLVAASLSKTKDSIIEAL